METTELMDGSIENAAELLLEQPETELEEEVEDTDDDSEGSEPELQDQDEDQNEDENEDDFSEDDEDEDDAVPESQTFTVKIDGEEKAVTLDELKQGFSGQKFVQKGMQENAQARKQTEDV